MSDPLDIKKIRRNWQRIDTTAPRSGRAPAAPSPTPPVRADLLRLHELLSSQFAPQFAVLAPFLIQLAQGVSALEDESAGVPDPARPPPDQLRAALVGTLEDLEDLLEVFTLPRR